MLRRRNCLFTAGSKSILALPSAVHPYECCADSGCLAAAVLELFPLFFCFLTDGQQSQLLFTVLVIGSAIRACCREALQEEDEIVQSASCLRGTGGTQDVEINFK